jgi:hypothetical protein
MARPQYEAYAASLLLHLLLLRFLGHCSVPLLLDGSAGRVELSFAGFVSIPWAFAPLTVKQQLHIGSGRASGKTEKALIFP